MVELFACFCPSELKIMTDIRITKDGGKVWTAKLISKSSFFGPYGGDLAELARNIFNEEGSTKRLSSVTM